MSPEYAEEGKFSVKSDVFSFGVLILEILSGMRNRGFFHPDHHHNLLGHVGTHLILYCIKIMLVKIIASDCMIKCSGVDTLQRRQGYGSNKYTSKGVMQPI